MPICIDLGRKAYLLIAQAVHNKALAGSSPASDFGEFLQLPKTSHFEIQQFDRFIMPHFSSQNISVEQNHVLMIRMDNAKIISHILKAINFKENSVFCCTKDGLKVTVEDMKSVQLNAFIEPGIFQSYVVKEEEIKFQLNLTVLLECLNVFGSSGLQSGTSPALKLYYNGHGTPVSILLEESGVITDCKIRTVHFDPVLDYDFGTSNVIGRIIMSSECLKEVFCELDSTSDCVQFSMSPDSANFRITTFGHSGTYHVDIPKASDVIESLRCTSPVSFKYKLSLMKPSIRPLGIAQKVSLRIDDTGLICFQFMIKVEDNHNCYIDFYCPADVDFEEDE
ncbi:cell cycle checkpoint protein RAD1 isoform X2 [Daphnia magna]|uniref:cell cycle checkpoint protein RAD1 isoform X2 n=1 Tax=Daphnia magna TaxID=35525 RepID=UPI001403CD19|nr:cell cycle checkpoint protein RAD1 isoform X2 [Daphnia magna]